MTNVNRLDACASPEEVFISCWEIAKGWKDAVRARVKSASRESRKLVENSLSIDSGPEATRQLLALLAGDPASEHWKEMLFCIMRCIDKLFSSVHPRTRQTLPHMGGNLSLPSWLDMADDRRADSGSYWTWDEEHLRLIPKGPLQRSCRSEFASSTDDLADRFSCLSVVPCKASLEGREVQIEIVHVDASVTHGVKPTATASGSESILFVPVAQEKADLETTLHRLDVKSFVDYNLVSGVSITKRIRTILPQLEKRSLDIAIAPELTVSERDAGQLAGLLAQCDTAPRLFICGSGLTADCDSDQHNLPWNQSHVLNGIGTVLWRQRKVMLATMSPDRAKECAIAQHDDSSTTFFENTATGDCVVVADIDSLGRCVVLICQDLESELADTIVKRYQPDWVFTPVLDVGVDEGRWGHRRAFALSGYSYARFLIVSSLSLARAANKSNDTPCGMAVGPRDGLAGDAGRAVALVNAITEEGGTHFGILTWRDDSHSWKQTTVGSTQTRAGSLTDHPMTAEQP
ncbi:hypothetical protein AC233_30850 [Burkholderia sp. HB1]|uniref:hypothetical protein n=1 Tax=Paraburkholderia sp. RL17-368-BIF-A TaxID=3031628 RepID=UPI0006B3F5C3|nr:hypothetical protein AC233_30850 [Burkholderia sp. HB1]